MQQRQRREVSVQGQQCRSSFRTTDWRIPAEAAPRTAVAFSMARQLSSNKELGAKKFCKWETGQWVRGERLCKVQRYCMRAKRHPETGDVEYVYISRTRMTRETSPVLY